MRDLGEDARILQCKIEIQENRFAALGESLGLGGGTVGSRGRSTLPEGPIKNALEEIKRLTTDVEVLRRKYRLDVRQESDGHEPKEVVNTESSERTIRRPLSRLSFRRLVWAAFDKEKVEQLAADLKELNDGLEYLLQAEQKQRYQQGFRAYYLTWLNTNNVAELRTFAEASANTYIELASPATQKFIRLDAESGSMLNAPVFDIVAFSKPAREDRERATAVHLETRAMVVLEWRSIPSDLRTTTQTMKRIHMVADLLRAVKPPTMRTLNCLGLVQDRASERVSLVYRYPQNAAREPAISLFEFLDSPDKRNALPSLDDRYALALKLAETVFHIHMSGWLHKGIRTHNVLFFPRSESSPWAGPLPRSGILREPYLTGFEFSREGILGAGTETVVETAEYNRYRHPNCQGPVRDEFRKAYDLYSLGMVLLEAGCWKAFNKYPLYKDTVSASENRERIMRQYLTGDVAYYAGKRYEKVVLDCLSGEFGTADGLEEAEFQERVYEALVKPLAEIVGREA